MNQPTHPELLDAFPAATVDKFVHDRGDLVGRDDVEASIQSGIDAFGALITHSIAVRGDRHMLIT
jgi:hypothetical protein